MKTIPPIFEAVNGQLLVSGKALVYWKVTHGVEPFDVLLSLQKKGWKINEETLRHAEGLM